MESGADVLVDEISYYAALHALDPYRIRYEDLNYQTRDYIRRTACTITYMSICLSCVIWQIITAVVLAWKSRKWMHFILLFQTLLCFFTILCSVLNPVTSVDCHFRFWVSIVTINLGGCCIQNVLLYKAYLCYERSTVLLSLGLVINTGYIILTIIYALYGQVPTYKDIIGNCIMYNLEWPALIKLGMDIVSNGFLSVAFLLVIFRHYRVFGNNLYKSLLSNGVIYSAGVIASNIITGILISTHAMGGLSADLYSFDWVITSYLLIRQFKANKSGSPEDEEDSQSIQSTRSSLVRCNNCLYMIDVEKNGYTRSLSPTIGPE